MQSIIDEVKTKTNDPKKQREIVDKVFEKSLPKITSDLYTTLEETSHIMLTENRYENDEFRARLNMQWFQAFDLLEKLSVVSYEIGDEINKNAKVFVSKDNAYLFEVLLHLHARSIQITEEVLVLMKNGYADGAIARWRTLYEISVIALFISKYGNDIAKRYKEYSNVETYKEMKTFIEKNPENGFKKVPKKEVQRQEKNIDDLKTKYGNDFINNYGWTNSVLVKGNRTFEGIEIEVEKDHLRPFYKWACNAVHAGPKAAYYKMGVLGKEKVLLTGPTNYGFADPGQNTGLSLVQVTSILVLNFMDYDNLVSMEILTKYYKQLQKKFVEIQRKIEKENKEKNS